MRDMSKVIDSEINNKLAELEEDAQTIRNLRSEISELNERIDRLTDCMMGDFAIVTSLIAVNHRVYSGSNHKVPLIKIFRAITGDGLYDSKKHVELFTDLIPIDQVVPF